MTSFTASPGWTDWTLEGTCCTICNEGIQNRTRLCEDTANSNIIDVSHCEAVGGAADDNIACEIEPCTYSNSHT